VNSSGNMDNVTQLRGSKI